MNKKIINYLDKHISSRLEGKNIFITGGNSGVGLETAKECAYLGANLFLLCRNLAKAESAKNEILLEFPNTKVMLIKLDLASLKSIKDCVNEVKKYDVDIFINNAGVYRLPKGVTKDNFEITMGTNFIGTCYLNDLLNEYFVTLSHKVHVLFTTSITSKMSKINYNDFYSEKKYKYMTVYARSKVAINNLYFTYLEEKKDKNILYSLVHPGITYTPLITKGYRNKFFEKIASIFMRGVFHRCDKAALMNIYAINLNKSCMVGPRGLLGVSGYPHLTHFSKSSHSLECVEFGRNEIRKVGF